MDTIAGGGYSLEDLQRATDLYVAKRTKTWLGVCWYKPNVTLYLDWDDETLCQVGEILSCPKAEAEHVLKLLKAAGMHFVFATHVHEEPEREEDEDEEDEEFDDEGWLTSSGNERKREAQNKFLLRHTDVVGRNYRYLGILSERGLRRQKQIIFRDGGSCGRIFFPGEEIPIMAQYAAHISEQYEKKKLHQIRLMLKLQIYYLIIFCIREQNSFG